MCINPGRVQAQSSVDLLFGRGRDHRGVAVEHNAYPDCIDYTVGDDLPIVAQVRF